MTLSSYLDNIRNEVGDNQYKAWEEQAQKAYSAFKKQAMHSRGKNENHDPHAPRAGTVGGLIVALYELHNAGESDVVINLINTRSSSRTSKSSLAETLS